MSTTTAPGSAPGSGQDPAPRSAPRLTIVGAGVIGRHHGTVVDELRGEVELVSVADVVPERAAELTATHGGTPYASLTEALAGTDTDVVVICTPTGTHADLAIEALKAGKDVIIEKPADITPERVDDIIAARDASGRLVSVISQHRFDPATKVVLDTIAAGGFGRIVSGIASIDWWRSQGYYDSGNWRGTWALDGGGALMNQGVHTVDLLVATMGRPVEVFAYTGTLAHERIEVEDVAVGVVRFESGALGVLHATTAAYPGMSARLQVHGDRGSIVIDNDLLTFIHRTPVETGAAERAYGDPNADLNQVAEFADAAAPVQTAGSDPGALDTTAHRRQYENMLAALDGTEEVRVDLETNRQAIAIITGVYESARTGRPVILT